MLAVTLMEDFCRLGERYRDEVVALLANEPHLNILMLANILRCGMDPGATIFHGEYFGRVKGSEFVAVGALYGLGSLLVYGAGDDVFEGIGDYLRDRNMRPFFISGKRAHVERTLSEIRRTYAATVSEHPTDFMILSGTVNPDVDVGQAREAGPQDLDSLVELSVEMERELFAGAVLEKAIMRDLLSEHIEGGTLFVIEREGEIVSKAQGTIAKGFGAHVGGVYTAPGFRGSGYSTACTASLCRRLLDEVDLVTLSVQKDNPPALAVYRRIGFTQSDDFLLATISYRLR